MNLHKWNSNSQVIRDAMKKLWKQKLQWDEILTGDLLNEWNDSAKAILELKDMAFSRAAISIPLNEGTFQMHIFADASTKAYGSVAFVFVCQKSCRPLKDGWFQRVDATKTRAYSRTCSCTSSFLPERIGKDNPADLVTRGVSGGILQKSELWVHGPNWLENSDDSWLHDEVQAPEVQAPAVSTMLLTQSSPEPIRRPLLLYNHYSSWTRLTRVTAFVFRAIRAFERKMKPAKVLPIDDVPPLCAVEIQQAENHWLRYVQSQYFTNEISLLQKGKPVLKSSPILELSPFLDNNNIMRLGGLQALDEPMDVKHPIVLPSHSYLLNLIIDIIVTDVLCMQALILS
ncbi:uncharacterized protein LOC129921571 [Episyrphus balteatus]|uniref:uncharacterized protein LOC129921571 n=1 Tax=Episyrphus balteatus TaxID=286459 RepID=UPI002486388D|nr:uncharacterized protein LOC129921571 [Episyrphus balteatus]